MKKIFKNWLCIFLWTTILLLAVAPQAALSESKTETRQAHSFTRLLSEKPFFTSGTQWLGLHVQLDKDWHTYWSNPGDSASAPFFDFEFPNGMRLVKTHFPRPERIPFGPLQSFGYEGDVLFLFEVFVDADEMAPLENQPISVKLEAEWLVCKEVCLPGTYVFELSQMYFSAAEAEANASNAAALGHTELFEKFRGQLPVTLTSRGQLERKEASDPSGGWQVQLTLPSWNGESSELRDELENERWLDVLPFSNQWVGNQEPRRQGREVTFLAEDKVFPAIWEEQFLLLGRNKSYVLSASSQGPSLGWMMVFAFLGGLLLNLMPCVFPVLALKAYSLVNSTHSSPVSKSSLAMGTHAMYGLGVVVSFWLLAGVLVLLRQAGEEIGWGFHLQSPFFVGALIVLFVAMALIFLDVLPSFLDRFAGFGDRWTRGDSRWNSFFTGVLAVIVASPCTAPFMGAAMGYALTQTTLIVFVIFTSLGLGLAAPFLIFAVFPAAARFLPKPGAWMNRLKKWMALPLFATALWLAWVFVLLVQPVSPTEDDFWQTYSAEKRERVLDSGQAVFVNFTAAWCISCQVNERLVFQQAEVQQFFAENGIVPLKADWTKKDEVIGAEIRRHGRAGVPLYLFYPEGNSSPLILPEVLTSDLLLQALRERSQAIN